MMEKHGSLRKFSGQGIFINLYKQVHGTLEIESPALPWHTIQMNTYFPKSWFSKLWLFKQKLSPHNTDTNTLLVNLHPFIYFEVKTRKMMTSVGIFTERASLGCSHQPSPSWKTPDRTTRTRMGETRVWKKRDEAKQVRRIWKAQPVQVNTEPPSHLTIVRCEKKWRFLNFLLSKGAGVTWTTHTSPHVLKIRLDWKLIG